MVSRSHALFRRDWHVNQFAEQVVFLPNEKAQDQKQFCRAWLWESTANTTMTGAEPLATAPGRVPLQYQETPSRAPISDRGSGPGGLSESRERTSDLSVVVVFVSGSRGYSPAPTRALRLFWALVFPSINARDPGIWRRLFRTSFPGWEGYDRGSCFSDATL